MADPLSVAAGVAGLASLGIEVTQSLVDFYKASKKRDSDLGGIIERLTGLLDIFQYLKKTLVDCNFQEDDKGLIERIETSIQNCQESIQELQDECHKLRKASSSGITDAVKAVGRQATYPFRRSTLQKLEEDIGEIRSNLSSALDVLQLKDTKKNPR